MASRTDLSGGQHTKMEGGGWSVCTIEVGGPAKIELRWSVGESSLFVWGGRPVEKLMRNEDGNGEASNTWVVATQIFCMFTPKLGEDEPNLTKHFSKGLVQPTKKLIRNGLPKCRPQRCPERSAEGNPKRLTVLDLAAGLICWTVSVDLNLLKIHLELFWEREVQRLQPTNLHFVLQRTIFTPLGRGNQPRHSPYKLVPVKTTSPFEFWVASVGPFSGGQNCLDVPGSGWTKVDRISG